MRIVQRPTILLLLTTIWERNHIFITIKIVTIRRVFSEFAQPTAERRHRIPRTSIEFFRAIYHSIIRALLPSHNHKLSHPHWPRSRKPLSCPCSLVFSNQLESTQNWESEASSSSSSSRSPLFTSFIQIHLSQRATILLFYHSTSRFQVCNFSPREPTNLSRGSSFVTNPKVSLGIVCYSKRACNIVFWCTLIDPSYLLNNKFFQASRKLPSHNSVRFTPAHCCLFTVYSPPLPTICHSLSIFSCVYLLFAASIYPLSLRRRL